MGNLLDWLIENESSFRQSRVPSLYSDLSVQKTTNPEGYLANVTTWQSALTAAAIAGKLPSGRKLILDASDEILDALASPQYGKPSGLGLVLDESVKSGKMLDLKDFSTSTDSIYHHSWIPSPWAVVRWGLRQTGLFGNNSYDFSGHLKRGQLVIIAALEDFSKHIVTARSGLSESLTDRLMTREEFSQKVKTNCKVSLSEAEEQVLLKFMSRDKHLLSYDDHTVKFKATSSTSPEPLTSEDATIASLKTLMSNLEVQVSELEKRSEALRTKAASAVQNKNRQMAMSALKSKKLVEKTLQQRTDTLHRLEEVFTKIEEAVDQVQIVQVMQASADTLKTLNKRAGSVEKIEDIVEDLREQMTAVGEASQVLQEPLDQNAIIDETEIDDELEALEQKERESQEKSEAETTRKRLAELDSAERRQRAEESKLQSSIEQLENLTIAQSEGASQQATRVPEQASG